MQLRRNLVLFSLYGLVLCAIGVFVTGAGHGTYALIGLAGAPFSFLGIPISIIAAFAQWMLLVLVGQQLSRPRVFHVVFLVLHYVSAVLLLSLPSSAYADWSYTRNLPQSMQLILLLGFCWYLLGQFLFWKTIVLPKKVDS